MEKKAYTYMAALCSRREICSGQARQMLERFLQKKMATSSTGTPSADSSQSAIIDSVIKMLIADGFIDDRRFLAAYLKDKIEFAGWGPKKISAQLQEWGFEQKAVDEALAEHSGELNASLRKILKKKKEQLNRESSKKLEASRAKSALKIEKLQAALDEAEGYKEQHSTYQKLQRAKYEASMTGKALEAANRKKLISYGISRGFALKDIAELI